MDMKLIFFNYGDAFQTTLRVIRRWGVGGTQRASRRGTQTGAKDLSLVCLSLSGAQRGHSGETANLGTRDANRREGIFASLPQPQPDSHKDSHSDSHSDSHARTRFDLLTSLARTHDTPCTTRDA